MSSTHHKREDTADGCRSLASDDLGRAAVTINDHMRGAFERSARIWTVRADLLGRLENSLRARVERLVKAGDCSVDADLR